MTAKKIKLITQILNNRDLCFIENNNGQASLAKEIMFRLEVFDLKN